MKFCRTISLLLTLLIALAALPTAGARAEEVLYSIGVDLTNQIVTVYTVKEGEIVRQMISSTGALKTPTVTGTFTMPKKRNSRERSEWYHFSGGSYAHYATRIWEGYMFHSYLYYRSDESRVEPDTVALLGTPASHGCMRMYPDDAKWIAKNCPPGTKVKIYYGDTRDEYLRALLKTKTFSVDDGIPYSEFIGGASHDGELGYGSTGEQVRALQNRLMGLGLYGGKASGSYDADMVKTISTLQEALGLTVNGKVSKGLWTLLFSDEAPTSDLSNVSVGASGPMVSYVQALLKKAALYKGEITGLFDADTDAAVRRYQTYAGLEVDGVFTTEQCAALAELIDDLKMRFPSGYALESSTVTRTMATIATRVRLNVRESASKESKSLGQLEPETVVEVVSREDDWSQISYKGNLGYVLNEYISTYSASDFVVDYVDADAPELVAFDEKQYEFSPFMASEEIAIGTGKKNDVMIFRKEKSKDARIAFALMPKASIELDEVEEKWAKATYCGAEGYILVSELNVGSQRALKPAASDANAVSTARNLSDAGVNVYENVSVNSAVIGTLEAGAQAEVLKQGETWSQIAYNGGVGYIENTHVQIGMLSERMEQYIASVSGYLAQTGSIEGVTMPHRDRDIAAEIASDEVIPEVNLDAVEADFLGEDAEFDEQIDTSAARAAFDAADAESDQDDIFD